MISQLSLFDTATVVKPTYKIGDRVKVRKRPIAASYIKKGDIVEIVAVHPLNGSIKFWNERSERSEYLHPDEISCVITSETDSVTPAEVAVTESKLAPSNDDSVTPAEVAVTESKLALGNDDSVTPAEVAVTESKLALGNDDSVIPAEVAVTESKLAPGNVDLALKAISTYSPKGTARGGQYYRLSYRDNGKVRHQHIRGGNTDSPRAQAKVAEVRSLLAAGIAPSEIAAMLKNFTSRE
jgi:hypothetical protein